MTGPVRYGDWSKDRHGWLFGLSGAGCVTVLLAGLPTLLAIGTHRWVFALGWLPIWAAISVGVVVPVRGRPALRWLTDATRRALGRVLGWADWQSLAATGSPGDLAVPDLPGVLSGVRTHDGPPYGVLLARPAIVQDSIAGTWAAVARISHPGIGFAELGSRERMASGLAELLEGAATAELISLLAIQVRTVPDDGAERAAWQRRNLHADAPPLALAVTAELGAAMLQVGVQHEAFVTVVVPEARIGRHAKEAGGGIDGRARVLYGVMNELTAHLTGPVGCSDVSWLDSAGLAAAIRTGFAPGERAALIDAELATHDTQHPAGCVGLPMAAAGPTVAPAAERRHYHHDAWTSATCTVLLPDSGALMGALAPVFTPTAAGERRSVTVFYAPLSRQKADKQIGRDAMSAGTAAELRHRLGFQSRAIHHRDAQRVQTADVRLAAGKALVRVGIAAAVTVPAHWSISEHGRRLEASIRGAGYTPLRLDLAQDSGFAAACIPLGIGLPRRRDTR